MTDFKTRRGAAKTLALASDNTGQGTLEKSFTVDGEELLHRTKGTGGVEYFFKDRTGKTHMIPTEDHWELSMHDFYMFVLIGMPTKDELTPDILFEKFHDHRNRELRIAAAKADSVKGSVPDGPRLIDEQCFYQLNNDRGAAPFTKRFFWCLLAACVAWGALRLLGAI